ncbi:class I SAM-dependent methyltransferase [Bradyrhizobium sp. WSM1417]|uniref:class I SAM-dependent methyltransferase n=1 Tax=Bradyrhizobium sp. WSM1417 TaxID=754500 RepID=UPI0012EB3035|nr:class I SAM-dependent methyltransferase [Bradyrhizobium sp. WSM1417]
MEMFFRIMQPRSGARILDVGGLPTLNGVPGIWQEHTERFHITLLNLPGSFGRFSADELANYDLIEADACKCELTQMYDLVFCNAVIEHVGSFRRQQMFAEFIRSTGKNYWVQTPSPYFPIEAHCDIPFWWFLPLSQRKRMIWRWYREGYPFLGRQMSTTRPIWSGVLDELFPRSRSINEYFLGLPKSQIRYRMQ